MGRWFPRVLFVVQERAVNTVVQDGPLQKLRGVLPRHGSTPRKRPAKKHDLLQEGSDERGQGSGSPYGVNKGNVSWNEGLPCGSDREAPPQQVLTGVAAAPAEGAGAVRARGPVLGVPQRSQAGLRRGPFSPETGACGRGEVAGRGPWRRSGMVGNA